MGSVLARVSGYRRFPVARPHVVPLCEYLEATTTLKEAADTVSVLRDAKTPGTEEEAR